MAAGTSIDPASVGKPVELGFVEQVLRQIEAAIRAGSAFDIDRSAIDDLLTKLRPDVDKQSAAGSLLRRQQKWFDDSQNVLLSANMLGVIATCIARLNHQRVVDNDALTKAFALVKKECGGRFGPEACYCGCGDPP
jgi:hypothetical protein